MTDFIQYLVDQVVNEKLPKRDAISLLRQFESGDCSKIISEIHPLLHQNTSILSEQRFSSTFSGDEFFLVDHIVSNQKVLPGVIYLEMFRAAVEKAAEIDTSLNCSNIELYDVLWSHPVVIGESGVILHTSLFAETDGSINIELYNDSGTSKTEPTIYGQGRAVVTDQVAIASVVNINEQMRRCNRIHFNQKDLYRTLKSIGLAVGVSSQVIDEVFVGEERLLAKLVIPFSLNTLENIALPPSVLDGVLQAVIGLSSGQSMRESISAFLVPFSLKKITILHPCSTEMWALILVNEKSARGVNVDIDLCDHTGLVCVQLRGFALRELSNAIDESLTPEEFGGLLLQPQWKTQPIDISISLPDFGGYQVLVCKSDDQFVKTLQTQLHAHVGVVNCVGVECEYERSDISGRYSQLAIQVFEQVQSLLESKLKAPVLVQVVIPHGSDDSESALLAGVAGILKSAHLENPKLIGQVIEVPRDSSIELLTEYLLENRYAPIESQIRYQNMQREVLTWREVEAVASSASTLAIPWRDYGVYWITGGAGGLGLLFAEEIAQRTKSPIIILTGRSALDERKKARLDTLKTQGAEVIYQTADITDQVAVTALVEDIQLRFGKLNGVIHSAGIIRDNFIIKKTVDEFSEVLGPKVQGLVNLDKATQDIALDFMVVFSSMASVLGNAGQVDYAAGNAFMDAYSRYRNKLVAANRRQGKTMSINWPLWKHGGMQIDEHTEQMIAQNTGTIALRTETGIKAYYQALILGGDQWAVVEGIVPVMREKLLETSDSSDLIRDMQQSENLTVPLKSPRLHEKTLYCIKGLFGDVVKMDIDKLDSDEPLESYGIDSVMITQLNRQLNEVFGELSKTLFYEYQTLAELTEYFITEHTSTCLQWTGLHKQADMVTPRLQAEISEALTKTNDFPLLTSFKHGSAKLRNHLPQVINRGNDTAIQQHEPIAIIGISGRYPQAKNLEEYWDNLAAGKDCITEIPQERWSLEEFFVEDMETAVEEGKSYSKWGGFIDGFDEFDPLFFGISPHDAMNMDPQERLFMQSCWHTLEDAGYTRKRLSDHHKNRVGVFAGITKTGFDLYGPYLWSQGEKIFPHTSFSSVANRISYFMNLRGPSMPIDTMCSSSLTAIHEACEHLYRGDCELALAGGVNLYLHPSNYIGLCSANMLSTDGKCKSFGEGGNGFVPGEGVGTVLLKPLSQAETDGDHIYAVIRASCINHGGKTNGYTVPSPIAQGALIRDTIQKAGISARAITYIEAHGTGTKLGDPIEVTGLTQAFREDTRDTRFCALGSAKSNIGHLEAAAGIAGLTKIILQMQHQKLVPSLHAQVLNPNINFGKTPFIVQRELAEWECPVLDLNGDSREYPRIAGISSFGAGGANAHVIIEEYRSSIPEQTTIHVNDQHPALVVLSAKNGERLKVYAQQLLDYISRYPEVDIIDLAYTLQTGREAMEERLGLLVDSVETLTEKLRLYVNNNQGGEGLYRGGVKQHKDTLGVLTSDETFQEMVDKWRQRGQYNKLLEIWVKGMKVDWSALYGDYRPHRISLPTYPFTQKRYWIPKLNDKPVVSIPQNNGNSGDSLENLYDKLFDDILSKKLSVDKAIERLSQEFA